jgi:hypothetical protein
MFFIFRSSSMGDTDHQPLKGRPGTGRIVKHANNRLGAVYSALYSFWTANDVQDETQSCLRPFTRRDAYSVILFDKTTNNALVNDLTSSPDQLLDRLLLMPITYGTNFQVALRAGQAVMLQNWSTERRVLIFCVICLACILTSLT